MLRANTVSIVVRKMSNSLKSVIKKIPATDLMDHVILRFSYNHNMSNKLL